MSFVKKALELDPENGAYLDSLGWIYYKKGMVDEALIYLEKSSQLIQEDSIIIDHLGDAYYKNGELKKALGAWEEAYKCDPERKEVKEKIDGLKKELGEKDIEEEVGYKKPEEKSN